MPEGDGITTEELFHRESLQLAGKNFPPSEQYPAITPHRTPPASFCAQQSPHRVQSSTNLDLVDCVGSDLLLAMNCLDVGSGGGCGGGEQGWAAQNLQLATANNQLGTAAADINRFSGGRVGARVSDGADGAPTSTPSPPREEFLPLAALAPPPTHQPAWLIAQRQQARTQNEHFPSRIFGDRYRGAGGCGSDADSAAEDRRSDHSSFGVGLGVRVGVVGGEDSNGRDYSQAGSSGSLRGSPGLQIPAFAGMEQNPSRGPSPGGGGGRRPSSGGGGRGTPHLDESWTAVLNAPAGAELMEFLTEQASRALVLWNVEAISEEALRAACEVHGPLYYMRAEHRRKRVVFIAYYDVRDAVNAHQALGRELSQHLYPESSRPPPAVHFSVELHAGFSYKEGSLVVHDLPSQATEADVGGVFQRYGDLRGVTRLAGGQQQGGHSATYIVEFCSIQDARVASQELTVRNPWGHTISVEPAVRSEAERSLGRQLHSTLNRWTAEATQAKAVAQASAMFAEPQQQVHSGGMLPIEDRMRGSSPVVLSGRSSDSDSPPPHNKQEDYSRDLVYMESYTPMTSANTTPATTPGSTPPSGADAYYSVVSNGGGKSPGMQKQQQYMGMCHGQQFNGINGNNSNNNGPGQQLSSSSRISHLRGMGNTASPSITSSSNSGGGSMHVHVHGDSSSPGSHQLYAGSGGGTMSGSNGPTPGHHSHVGASTGGGQHHHPAPRMPTSQHMHISEPQPRHMSSSSGLGGGGSGVVGGGVGSSHPLSASPGHGPSSYGGSPASSYFVDISPGYHGDCDDDHRTPSAPMWPTSLSLSPRSGRGGGGGSGGTGMRSSPPLLGCHGGAAPGGPGGLGYKDRSRQMSLDEGRLTGGGCGGGGRSMRSNSDSAQMMISPGCGGGGGGGGAGGGNGGDEFSLDLKKVSKGIDKRTTIMIRNIPNKYTQAMLLQEIDATYRGAYDFFYLPIDFKNKCNVGYAFINFMDYRRIVPFFREFNAQRWKNFNSEKVCAISYARIQGKASMISRFQNSSLMEKDGEYRPLIFHSSGVERGRPEPFPASSKVFRGPAGAAAGPGMAMGYGNGRDRERSVSSSSSLV